MIFNVHILFRCTISNQTARRANNSSAGSDFVLGFYILIVTKLAILFHLFKRIGQCFAWESICNECSNGFLLSEVHRHQ